MQIMHISINIEANSCCNKSIISFRKMERRKGKFSGRKIKVWKKEDLIGAIWYGIKHLEEI